MVLAGSEAPTVVVDALRLPAVVSDLGQLPCQAVGVEGRFELGGLGQCGPWCLFIVRSSPGTGCQGAGGRGTPMWSLAV